VSIRSKSKIFRLTELQLEQLEQHLEIIKKAQLGEDGLSTRNYSVEL